MFRLNFRIKILGYDNCQIQDISSPQSIPDGDIPPIDPLPPSHQATHTSRQFYTICAQKCNLILSLKFNHLEKID